METTLYNIYCDESCHLESDGQPVMVLGAIAGPADATRDVHVAIRSLKERHGLSRRFEAKWSKVSVAKVAFYIALVDYFMEHPTLRLRALVANDKQKLRHADFEQDHDTWYHKMYFEMLRFLIRAPNRHRIYIDIKDTRGGAKADTLHNVLARNIHDFRHEVVERIQIVRSDEVELVQLVDVLIGAISYRNRGLSGNEGKVAVIKHLEKRLARQLTGSTPLTWTKVNVFQWHPRESE